MNDSSAKQDRGDVRRLQADGAVLFVGPNLRVRVTVLKPGVVLASAHGEVVGSQDVSAETALLAELELERAGTLTLFADLRHSRPQAFLAMIKKVAPTLGELPSVPEQ